jgi:glycosyltransferase involved in cell wall biosynthesis
MDPEPFVSVIVPCRNEALHFQSCLDALLANDYPQHQREILIVDGMSDDGTRELAASAAAANPSIQLLNNPKKSAPAALNIGLAHAKGSVVLRMDAHAACPPHYISTLVRYLRSSGADNVGGLCRTCPANEGAIAGAIAAALSHPFGVGNSYFRIGTTVPRWVDTVPFGCYRREVFERIGTFDEELSRNQDDEFNMRLLRAGGKILLVPDVVCDYVGRSSLRKLWAMMYQYGLFKPLVVRKIQGVLTLRQLIPALLVLSLLLTGVASLVHPISRIALASILGLYIAADMTSAGTIAMRSKVSHGLASLLAFPCMHLSYGIGYWIGIWRFLVLPRQARVAAPLPLSR